MTIYVILDASGWEPFFVNHDPAPYREALNPEEEQRHWLEEGWAYPTREGAEGSLEGRQVGARIEAVDAERMAHLLRTEVLGEG